jgi:hypothetical protein
VAALGAPEEPHLTFIRSPQLAKPPESKIMLAFRAFYLDSWHGFNFGIFIIHNRDLIFRAHPLGLHLVCGFNLTDISAFSALKLTTRRYHHRLTFRTEHRYCMSDQRRLTLLSGTLELNGGLRDMTGFNAFLIYTEYFFSIYDNRKKSATSESFFW